MGAPNLSRRSEEFQSRLGTGQRPRSKVVFYLLKRVLLSVPLEQLNDQTDCFGCAAPGADSPQINRQLARHRHDGFFARGSSGQRSFGQDLSPFYDWFVVRLEADQSPGQFHQGSSQARVAMFGHATLQPGVATGVFARAKPGVTANLTAIVKPVANRQSPDRS